MTLRKVMRHQLLVLINNNQQEETLSVTSMATLLLMGIWVKEEEKGS